MPAADQDEGDEPAAPPEKHSDPAGLDYPPPQLPGIIDQGEEADEFPEDAFADDVHDRLTEKRQKSWILQNTEDKKEKIRALLVRTPYDVTDLYHNSGCFQQLARSKYFESITLFVIGVNSVWMAYDTDRNTAMTILDAAAEFAIMENLFCTYFSFEWVVRFGAFRRKRDSLQDAWFVFDSMLLVLMISET